MKKIIDSLLAGILGHREKPLPCPPLAGSRVDLATYHCCGMSVGAPLQAGNGFFPDPSREQTVKDEKQGFEIGAQDGVLDYAVIDLELFPGTVTRNGAPLPHLRYWDECAAAAGLGEPWWRDEDGDEVLLFYEDGNIETQIEFPGKKTARFITLMRNPLMADAAQRQAYACDKPWPPRREGEIT